MNKLGSQLVTELKEKSGLDHEFFDSQMRDLFSKYNINPETLELDQLREILADFLQALILEDETQQTTKYA